MRILIADDHPLFRNGLVNLITQEKEIEIIGEADNGEKALEMILELKPDIALLDIHMPKMTGLQILKELKRIKTDVKTIFLTVYNDEDMFDEAMDNGISGYILKDSAANEIIDCIFKVAAGDYYISSSVSNFVVNRRDKMKKLESNKPAISDLSRAELTVLKLVAEGKTSNQIAAELFISPKTVENHRTNINSKLNLRGTHSLIKFAIENKSLL
jgi:DNA-binding NarL/FixJ family response regulator